ncbi:MAG: hypothetical protein AAF358_09480 [Pseudomonadota bacterium]
MNDLEQDIQFAARLARSGADAPLLGGRMLAWWGMMVALAYGCHYLLITGRLAPPGLSLGPAIGFLWLAFVVIASLGYGLLIRRYPFQRGGSGSAANRADRAIWGSAGLALGWIMVGALIRSLLDGRADLVFPWTVPMVFAIYGTAQLAVGWISSNVVLQAAGLLGGAIAMVCWLLTGQSLQFAVASAGAALTLLVPGLLLWRQESEPRP